MTMKVHPFAARFPLIKGKLFNKLVEDIRKDGLLKPVVRNKNEEILDGRNSVMACEKAGREIQFEEYDGPLSAVSYIIKCNLLRRDLTVDQHIALTLISHEASERESAKKRMAEGGRKGAAATKKKALPEKQGRAFSEGDESEGDTIAVGKKKRVRLVERIAALGGPDVKRYGIEQMQRIKKHPKGSRLEKEVISGDKTIKEAMKETRPQEAKRTADMPPSPWNGIALTATLIRMAGTNVKTRSPSKSQVKKFFADEFPKGWLIFEKEVCK